ncbi:MAG TPA: S-layer homology domain-containing protein [Nodosilinea sp.]|nr:S-layer homology domain-containing protein [Nodosilinea sp.]
MTNRGWAKVRGSTGIKVWGGVALGLGWIAATVPAQAEPMTPAALPATVSPGAAAPGAAAGAPSPGTTPVAQTPEGPLTLPFTDVPPDHWAYEALLNLAGVYGCVNGYPDGTFRGDAPVSRYEFAAGLDACLGALAGLAQQQTEARDQEVRSLIEAMERSLSELRQIEADLPESPAD